MLIYVKKVEHYKIYILIHFNKKWLKKSTTFGDIDIESKSFAAINVLFLKMM